ncbi:MAG: RiPP maturation radical SAM protein 1 [Desulfobacteraceae bacterium]|nr:RiPP maturation radical SAM protein 1 [Desulfobacteraceae bacterium]
MKHRLKPGPQVFKTIGNYAKKYQFYRLQPTDNNMSPEYYETLLPELAESPFKDKIKLLFEVKSIITRKQINALANAGVVYIHPGIENFSTRLLKLMKKGTNALQNIYFLKLCREYNLTVLWNYLIRIPGEKMEDYKDVEELIPKIVHLQPPCRGRTSKIECVRFSAYYKEKKLAVNIRPKHWYSNLFPEDRIDLSRVSYFFDADWKHTLDDDAYDGINNKIEKWFGIWNEDIKLPELVIKSSQKDGSLKIKDTRAVTEPVEWLLEPEQAAVYESVEDPTSLKRIASYIKSSKFPLLSQTQINSLLEDLIEKKLVIKERNRYLGLALQKNTPSPPISNRWSR